MEEIKVLIIDEHILVRRAIADILKKESNMQVRASGEVRKSEKLVRNENPDIVLLDIEGAASNGYSIFNTLRVRFPKLPVVVISSRSRDGAQAALYALHKGAVNVITKPEKNNTLLLTGDHLGKRLSPMIKSAARILSRDSVDRWLVEKKVREQDNLERKSKGEKNNLAGSSPQLIVIGGSMGGPKAMRTIFRKLSADFPIPIVAAQHFPKFYTHALVKNLKKNISTNYF